LEETMTDWLEERYEGYYPDNEGTEDHPDVTSDDEPELPEDDSQEDVEEF
jgi:hypothetical protein